MLSLTSTAHRYQQAKASGQGPHSKSSSAHSSRSTSPGPHWRNEGIAPYKTSDRRSLDPVLGTTVHSSPSRPGRSNHAAVPVEMETNTGRPTTLLPRPPRDRSEPCHFNALRSVQVCLCVCVCVCVCMFTAPGKVPKIEKYLKSHWNQRHLENECESQLLFIYLIYENLLAI